MSTLILTRLGKYSMFFVVLGAKINGNSQTYERGTVL